MCKRIMILMAASAITAAISAPAFAAGSHPGAATPPTTATMGNNGVTGGRPQPPGPRGGTNPCANYNGPGCQPSSGTGSGTNRQTCKQNGEGCLRPK